jgi:lysyl endopeptidase
MNKALLVSLFFSFSFLLSAQVTNEGIPESWKWNEEKNLTSVKLPPFDLKALQDEDAIFDTQFDRPWRFGKEFDVNYGLKNSGEWTEMENGDRIWRIRFHSKGAITLNFLLENFSIPRGAKIYLYSNDRTALLGAYDATQNNDAKVLGTWLVDGDDVWIEYFEPKKVAGQGMFTIKKVVHGYRSQLQFAADKGLNDSGNCNLDVDCEIDADLEALKNHAKKGVVMLLSGSSGFCSGSLINNTNNDGTPYVLTARHCGTSPANWAFRFNWISPNPVCATTQNSTNGPTTQTMSGAQSRANRQQSDFHLVEINNPIPGDWDVVWNGWDRSDAAPPKTFGIHHPSGDIMKVCVDNDAPYHANSPGQVWWLDQWETGVTEPGSSGSPLFDDNGRIIGQLWGGAAACSGTSNNGLHDYYGRFGISWNTGTTAATRLRDWLDPNDTGVVFQNAYPAFEVLDLDAGVSIANVPQLLCENTISPIITVRNLGNNTLVSADISYHLNDEEETTINWTGSLETGEVDTIELDPIQIFGAGTFYATLENPNGGQDESEGNNSASANFNLPDVFETTEIHFFLQPDNYGNETTWEFVNSSGDVLYSGGPYAQGNTTPIEATFNVDAEDCYTFTIFDSWGDGICCAWGNGSYSLTTAEGDIIIEGGDFGSSESTIFSNYTFLGQTEQELDASVSLYPNPTNGIVYFGNSTGNSLSFEIFNMLGQKITSGLINGENHSVDLSAVKTGLYFVKINDQINQTTVTKKLIVR